MVTEGIISDLDGEYFMVDMPAGVSEVGAVIEEIGPDVPAGFEKGMNVTLNPYTNCGKCASCRNGRVNACEHNETLGVQRNGVMCEYAVLPWTKIIPAGNISSRDCALIEPMSVGFHAVSRAQVIDNEYVMVIGCGMIGIGAIVRAALRGATVIAVDLDDEKLELAKKVGASYVVNSKTENVHERIQEITENGKVRCARCHLSFGPSSYASHLPYFGSCIHGCHPDDTGRQRTVDANGNRYLLRHTHHNGIFAYSASGLLLVHVQWLYT